MKKEETFFRGKRKENKGIKKMEKRKDKGKIGKTWKEIEKENENEKHEKIDEKKRGPNGGYSPRRPKKIFLNESFNRKS